MTIGQGSTGAEAVRSLRHEAPSTMMRYVHALAWSALKPFAVASASDMYSPFLVFPYHLSPGQWYTFEAVLTHTLPAPPPAAAAALGAWGAVAAALEAWGVDGAAAGATAAAGAPYH